MGSSRPEILGAYLTERLSVYDCPESCGADFSGPCGVAQSARVGAGGLLVHGGLPEKDRKSTRLNSSHVSISYAVFCLKKKKNNRQYKSRDWIHISILYIS